MLETNLTVMLILSGLLLALPLIAIALGIVIAFYRGWFTLPHPEPDRERIKAPQRPA